MERRQVPAQFHFRVMEPLHPPPRQNVDRGRYGPAGLHKYRQGNTPNGFENSGVGRAMGGGLGYSSGPGVAGGGPVKFVRNPKFPKSLYDVEMSLRQVIKDKPVKITPGMSFPDPKSRKSISNPKAPRVEYEFEPSRDDYNFIYNPLAGANAPGDDTGGVVKERYIDAVGYDSSDDSDDNDEFDWRVQDYDSQSTNSDGDDSDGGTEVALPHEDDREALYAHARPKAHRVRQAQGMETQPPAFEPQPPPPRAPVDPILVIPRAVVREEESYREHRHRNGSKNGLGPTPDDNNNVGE
ncbi:uncharacterized protein LOC110985756 [Acanthaster planci]|uniref:Uncharacterized protein LOC110985756 n=1 Tax=Acanthaster planci TaxID=133434 RepID=A0A8B7ZAM4_ACAPL|nr:uncharacterized protein LOC110985756 [Acanthaster planci]